VKRIEQKQTAARRRESLIIVKTTGGDGGCLELAWIFRRDLAGRGLTARGGFRVREMCGNKTVELFVVFYEHIE
jgi:hypothetical protein